MTIVPASRFCPSDLIHLGNNVGPTVRRDREHLAAIQRSLALHDEQVEIDEQAVTRSKHFPSTHAD